MLLLLFLLLLTNISYAVGTSKGPIGNTDITTYYNQQELELLPLFQAIKANNLSKVKELCDDVETYKSIHKKYNGQMPLTYAMNLHNHEIAQYLIFSGADLNCFDQEGDTPLHWAVILDKFDLVKWLLEKNADYQKKNHHNRTPLEACDLLAFSGRYQIAKELVRVGASILELNASYKKSYIDIYYDNFYSTPQMAIVLVFEAFKYAIEHNDLERFDELITHDTEVINAGIKTTDENNNSLLHLVAYTNSLDSSVAEIRYQMASQLIAKGADVNVKNKEGLTSLSVSNIPALRTLFESVDNAFVPVEDVVLDSDL